MKEFKKLLLVFMLGGAIYGVIEVLWRGYTHFSMIIAGGTCFSIFYKINEKFKKLSKIAKCFIGCSIITCVEFIFGIIFNVILKMGVWDYSDMPFNILGQICPLFSFFWFILSFPIIYFSNKLEKFFYKTM